MASYGHNYIGPVNRAIEPVGECRSEFMMFSELAKRFSFSDQFCRSAEEWLFDICTPVMEQVCSMDDLRKGAFRVPEPMAPYLDKKFPTESGKFEFMTEFNPARLKHKDPSYPYTLLTVASHRYLCSELTLAEHTPLPEITVHPAEAEKAGLKDGSHVLIKSRAGSVKCVLRTDMNMRRDCIVAERGGWIKAGHGLNMLAPDMISTVGDGTPYYGTEVRLSPVTEKEIL